MIFGLFNQIPYFLMNLKSSKLMDYTKEEFTEKLIKFFDRHAPSKKKMVPKIVREFHGHEEEVFDHLTRKYADVEGEEHTKKVSGSEATSAPNAANAGDIPT